MAKEPRIGQRSTAKRSHSGVCIPQFLATPAHGGAGDGREPMRLGDRGPFMADALLIDRIDGDSLALAGAGAWTLSNAGLLERAVETASERHAGVRQVAIDMGGVERLDTVGAWLLEKLVRSFSSRGCATEVLGLKQDYRALTDKLRQVQPEAAPPRRSNPLIDALAVVGKSVFSAGEGLLAILNMLGALAVALARVIAQPRRLRLTATV